MSIYGIVACIIAIANAAPQGFENNLLEDDPTVPIIDLSHFGASIFGVPSNKTGQLVASYDPSTDGRNPEELGEYLEGDMLMPAGFGRNGLIAQSSHWASGIVPYEISGYFGMHLLLVYFVCSLYYREINLKVNKFVHRFIRCIRNGND